jgi:transcriptional regulator with XRE-family HTH domain
MYLDYVDLRRFRESLGFNKCQFARYVGLSSKDISRIESGRRRLSKAQVCLLTSLIVLEENGLLSEYLPRLESN